MICQPNKKRKEGEEKKRTKAEVVVSSMKDLFLSLFSSCSLHAFFFLPFSIIYIIKRKII
jgi:hypothetical protein